jgi:hypothetical protein
MKLACPGHVNFCVPSIWKGFPDFPFGWKVVVRECECHHVLVTCYIAMEV